MEYECRSGFSICEKLKLAGQLSLGSIEIHVKSSDWHFHRHSGDIAYNNVILHVVYTDDMDISELRDKMHQPSTKGLH